MKIRDIDKKETMAVAMLAKGLDEYYKKEVKIYNKWEMPELNKYMDHIQNLINQNYIILVAIENNEIVGYIAGTTFLYGYDGKTHGKIEELYVSEKYRHKGVGTTLEKELEDRFKQKGAVGVFASIYTKNEASLRFHEKQGFQGIEQYIDMHKDL